MAKFNTVGSGSTLTSSDRDVLDKFSYDEPTDTVSTASTLETGLSSFMLGDQHKMSSGSDNIFYTNENTQTSWSACWSGLRDQSNATEQDATGVYMPQGRTYGETRTAWQPHGVINATPGNVVNCDTSITFGQNYSVTGLTFTLGESVASTDHLFINFYYGTDNTGINTFSEAFTGLAGSVDTSYTLEFVAPIEDYNTRVVFIEVTKASTRTGTKSSLSVRRSNSAPTEPGIDLLNRGFIDRNISVAVSPVSANQTLMYASHYIVDTSGGSVALTVVDDTNLQMFRVSDADRNFAVNNCTVNLGGQVATLAVVGDDITFFASEQSTAIGDGYGYGNVWNYFNHRTGEGGLV